MFYSLRPLLCAAAAMVAAAAGAATPVATGDHPAADLIIRDARVWTGNPAQPQAEAVAVLDGRITAVGSDAAVLLWRGPNTRVVDEIGRAHV
jgi:hypothetical protein